MRANNRPAPIVLTVLLAALAPAAAGGFIAGSPEHEGSRDPLATAMAAASRMEGDDALKARTMQDLLPLVAERRPPEDAAAFARAIPGYRGGMALGTLGLRAARDGRNEIARDLVAEAGRAASRERGWRGQQVTAAVVPVVARLDGAVTALQLIESLDDRRAAALAITGLYRELAHLGDPNPDRILERFQAADVVSADPSLVWVAKAKFDLALDRWSRGSDEDRAEATRLFDEGIDWLERSRANGGDTLLEVLPQFSAAGWDAAASRLASRGIAFWNALDPGSVERAALTGAVARWLIDHGMTAEVEQLGGEVWNGSSRIPAPVRVLYLSRLGSAWAAGAPESERALECWRRALEIGRGLEVERLRHLAVVHVAVALVESGDAVPAAVACAVRKEIEEGMVNESSAPPS